MTPNLSKGTNKNILTRLDSYISTLVPTAPWLECPSSGHPAVTCSNVTCCWDGNRISELGFIYEPASAHFALFMFVLTLSE